LGIENGGSSNTASSVSIGSDLRICERRKNTKLNNKNLNDNLNHGMKYMQKKLVRESTGSWRTGFVSSFAGMKGGLGLLFGLIEDCEKVLVFIVNVLLCLSVVTNTLNYFFHQPNFSSSTFVEIFFF
jgi:hypothetical protein